MARRRRRVRAAEVWQFPAAGFAATGLLATFPGSPLSPAAWTLRGPFGAFTWVAWFMATGLTLTLLLVAAARALARRTVPGRAVLAALAFGGLAAAAYIAAAQAARIEQHPLYALALAVAGLIALRLLAARSAPMTLGQTLPNEHGRSRRV